MANQAMTDVTSIIENDDFIIPTSRPNGPMYVAQFASMKQFVKMVLNPFKTRHSPTFKFAVTNEQVTPSSSPNWGNTFEIDLANSADIVIGAYLAITLPKIAVNSGYCRYVSYPGVNIVEEEKFKSSGWEFETLTWISNAAHRYYNIPKINLDVYNEITGQQNPRETRIAFTDTAEIIGAASLIAIDPVLDVGDSAPLLRTIGYATGSAPTGTAQPYALVGITQTTTQNVSTPVDLSATPPDPEPTPSAYPVVNVEAVPSVERTGAILNSYDGLQTWKTEHPATLVYHICHFWFNKSPRNALIMAAIALNLQTVIRIKLRPFTEMYQTTSGTALTAETRLGNTLSITPYLTNAYIAENVRVVFSNMEGQIIGNTTSLHQQSIATTNPSIQLHPQEMVSEFKVVMQDMRNKVNNEWDRFCAYNDGTLDDLPRPILDTMAVKINGVERESSKNWRFWEYLRPYMTHENVPIQKHFNCVPFTLYSDQYQPTSYVNFKTNASLELPIKLNSLYDTGTFSIMMYIIFSEIRFFRYIKGTFSTAYG